MEKDDKQGLLFGISTKKQKEYCESMFLFYSKEKGLSKFLTALVRFPEIY